MLSVEDMCPFIIGSREKNEPWQKPPNSREKLKIILNPEGRSYRRLYKQANEGRKKKKIVNNRHLSLINLNLTEQRRALLVIRQAVV